MRHHDVVILGAGMAGLTLARQLRRRSPSLDIALVEHRQFPVASATHKVGESTVEIASHYLAEELGLGSHLESQQLPKFGLRMFLRGESVIRDDLAVYDEIGASRVLPIPTYQLDRGRFENFLAADCVADGTRLYDGSTVRDISVQPGKHQVRVRSEGTETTLAARFLVDASGRRAWLRKQSALGRPARHNNHAVWFRVEGSLEIDDWGGAAQWQRRCHGDSRRYSTNHFTGPGYWLWLIPLASNATSVGLVFDPRFVDSQRVKKHDRLIQWLATEHPIVAMQLEGRKPLDYHVMENYAVASSQVFSSDGWMTSGDSSVFSDPLYSPGGDFIALANGYITELITGDVKKPEVYKGYEQLLLSFFTSTLSLYRGQYAGFGNRDLMVAKTLWDYAYYWGVLSKLYFSGQYTNLEFMSAQHGSFSQAATLNSGMQRRFRGVAKKAQRIGGEGRFFDHHAVELFHSMKMDLLQGRVENAGVALEANVKTLAGVADIVQSLLVSSETGGAIPELDGIFDELSYSPDSNPDRRPHRASA